MGKHWNEEWLREKYLKELLTMEEIAEKTDVGCAGVRNQLHKFDIEIIHPIERKKRKGEFTYYKKRKHFYQSTKWKETAKDVRERDGYKCLRCGKKQSNMSRKLHVHHIEPLKSFVKENGEVTDGAYAEENLMSLCGSCHADYEAIPVNPQIDVE